MMELGPNSNQTKICRIPPENVETCFCKNETYMVKNWLYESHFKFIQLKVFCP